MFGRHFLYILVRENGICHKMGVSSDIRRRVNDLNRQFGPFCLKRSLVLRTDSRPEACMLEAALKISYSAYNTPLPEEYYTDGETEWFAEACYETMCNSLEAFAKDRMGEGYSIAPINPGLFKSLTPKTMLKQARFQTFLEGRQAQIEVLCENTQNVRSFRSAMKLMLPNLIGVARLEPNDFSHNYEVFLEAGTAAEVLDELFQVSQLSADNDDVWAGANFCVTTHSSSMYKKASFSIPHQADHFERGWESKGKILTYSSVLEDLVEEYPVPPAYLKYVGQSFWDQLSPEDVQVYQEAFLRALFGHTFDDHVDEVLKAPPRTKKKSIATRGKKRSAVKDETPHAQMGFDFC